MPSSREAEALIRSRVRDVPDYPKPGILFKDITPLLRDSAAFRACIDELASRLSTKSFDYIAGIEARGFIIGSALAYRMEKPFVPIRKMGKLPYHTTRRSYDLEYGKATIEVHSDSVERGSRVVIIDDLLATGGTAAASAELLEELGATVVAYAFVLELGFLNGREKLGGREIISLVRY